MVVAARFSTSQPSELHLRSLFDLDLIRIGLRYLRGQKVF